MTNIALNRTVTALLTNKSGGSVAKGDVVIIDLTTASSFTTTTTGAYVDGQIGVVLEPNGIANNGIGMVAVGGFVPQINLSSSASLGDLFKTHTVAKQAVRHAAPRVSGDFGEVLGTGTTPPAMLFGSPVQAGVSLASVAEAGTGTNTTKAVTPAGLFPAAVDVASGTPNIGAAASRLIRITGTTTITAFDTVAAGIYRECYFAGALTLTHNGTSLILPGAANITTAAGDSFGAQSLGSGNWKVMWYTKADGTPIAGGGGGGTALKRVWSPDAPPASAGSEDSEFAAGSGGVPSGFTEYDPGSVLTVDESSTYKKLLCTVASGGFPTMSGIYRAIPAGNFTIWTKIHLFGQRTDYAWAGLALFEDATDGTKDIINLALSNRSSSGPTGISQFVLTAYNAYNTDSLGLNALPHFNYIYFRWRRNSTNYFPGWSFDGETFIENSSSALNPGFTPTHFGLAMQNSSSITFKFVFDFFRYVASDVGVNGIMNGAAVDIGTF